MAILVKKILIWRKNGHFPHCARAAQEANIQDAIYHFPVFT
jgi:hypothetical protein